MDKKNTFLTDLLNTLLNDMHISTIATSLNVANGTVKRWIDLDNIPTAYQFDLMKLNNMEIDYTQYTYKEKDQFFTPIDTAKYCYDVFKKVLDEIGENEDNYIFI